MTRTAAIVVTLWAAVLFLGCPQRTPRYTFTSADRTASRFGGWPDFLDVGGEPTAQPSPVASEARTVVEPDVIRQVGPILYVLNQFRGLSLINLDTGALLGQVPTFGLPRDLYIQGARAYVLVSGAERYTPVGNTITVSMKSRLYVVDIATPESAHILSQFDVEGDLVDSRLVGDVLYAVGADYQWYWVTPMAVKQEVADSWVTSIDLADPANVRQAGQVSFPGTGTVIHATDAAIFVAAPRWDTDSTDITFVDIADPDGAMAVRGSISVKGQVADRFKLDAYQGVLRVITSAWDSQRRVYISTVDLGDPDQLTLLADTEFESAAGDQLFATRFDGDRAYIVTYFVVDPLYVVDLSDPTKPTVAGQLEVPGWSTHIEPRGDRLLALGVDDTNGRKVSVSLFDVADPAHPSLIARQSFGDSWSWSNAYADVKSFAVFDDVLVAPFSGWSEGLGGYERLQFLSYTPESLTAHGYVDVQGASLRTIAYGANYYGLTTEQLSTIDASDLDHPAVTDALTLAENVGNFVELTPEVGAAIISREDTAQTVVRTVGVGAKGLGATLGEVSLSVGSIVDVFRYNQSVLLVGTDWSDADSHYTVARVDCSDPTTPTVTGPINVQVQPYWGYVPVLYSGRTSGWGGAPTSMLGMPNSWWWPWTPVTTAFVVDDTLVLRCWADHYDVALGDESPYEGLALVDLPNLTRSNTVGLGFAGIESLDAAGSSLILGLRESVRSDLLQPECAYLVRMIDIHTPAAGPAANVPGEFVQYDPVQQVLTLRDFQWQQLTYLRSTLRTVAWDGSQAVTPLDGFELPENTGSVLGAGGSILYDEYNLAYAVGAATVSDAGVLQDAGHVTVTPQWGRLLGGLGNSAYVVVGSSGLAHYRFTGNGALVEVVPVMGTPQSIRFGTTQAYVPLGYSGLATLGL